MVRDLTKICIFATKVVPMVLALLFVLNAILCYFNINLVIFNYLGGVSVFTLAYFYLWAERLKFCWHQKLFLHYITISVIIAAIDEYIGIPLSDFNYLLLLFVLFGIAVFVQLFMFLKKKYKGL